MITLAAKLSAPIRIIILSAASWAAHSGAMK
jgi:hypothetical protein